MSRRKKKHEPFAPAVYREADERVNSSMKKFGNALVIIGLVLMLPFVLMLAGALPVKYGTLAAWLFAV